MTAKPDGPWFAYWGRLGGGQDGGREETGERGRQRQTEREREHGWSALLTWFLNTISEHGMQARGQRKQSC